MENTAPASPERIQWLDTVRVLACFLVILCHCTDPAVPGEGVNTGDTAGMLIITFVRACVPLFVMISGALLLPMRGTPAEFFKKRFTRILWPFAIWGVLLALLPLPGPAPAWAPGNALKDLVASGGLHPTLYNVVMLPFNFTDTNIHFWFLYIIIGLYLFTPVISPWIRQASDKALAAFLGVWAFTLFLPYISNWPGHAIFPQLHGQCDWNKHDMTHYFGGYLGYFVLGHAMTRMRALRPSLELGAGVALFLAGWALTHIGFISTVVHRGAQKELEFFIEFLSPNVAMMTIGTFMACRAITLPGWLQKPMARLSALSFGIFLVHYWVITWVRDGLLKEQLHQMPVGAGIALTAVSTVVISTLIALALSKLPGKKWLLG